jgi:hypothetical protein
VEQLSLSLPDEDDDDDDDNNDDTQQSERAEKVEQQVCVDVQHCDVRSTEETSTASTANDSFTGRKARRMMCSSTVYTGLVSQCTTLDGGYSLQEHSDQMCYWWHALLHYCVKDAHILYVTNSCFPYCCY